jgi:starvation-inducible outer membrane lipoprotein
MFIKIRKLVLILALCFALIACTPAPCGIQMVAGGAETCQGK